MKIISKMKIIVSVLSITCVLYLLSGASYIRPGGGGFAAGMLGGTVTGLIVGNAVANSGNNYNRSGRSLKNTDLCRHGHAFGCKCSRCERHNCNKD